MKYGFLICAMILLFSCSEEVFYQESFDVSPAGWDYDDAKVFEFESSDSLSLFDITLDISHTEDYSYENLYILISTSFPDGSVIEDQVSIPFISESGTWQGKGIGEDRQLRVYLQQRTKFKQVGEYTITVAQHSREQVLKGIQQVRLSLIPTA